MGSEITGIFKSSSSSLLLLLLLLLLPPSLTYIGLYKERYRGPMCLRIIDLLVF
jgi:hypothetical protein